MQVLCNSCLSLHIYNDIYNIEYNNPFAGCIWSPKTMIKFINHYKTIDYTNIKLSFTDINEPHFYYVFKAPHIICNIDNLLNIHYVHSYDFCENNIDEFKDTYFRRLNRFNINEDPIFIMGYGLEYGAWYNFPRDYENCVKFNFMNAKTIQFTSYNIDIPVAYHYNKFLKVKSVVPKIIMQQYENILKNTIEELLKC